MLSRAFDLSQIEHPESPHADAVLDALEGKDVLISTGTLSIGPEFLVRTPGSLKAIATYSVGYDRIDLDACRARNIVVFNTPGVLSDAVAEVAMLLLLGAARRAREGMALLQNGAWNGWQPTQLNGVALSGKTVGIVGMGRIGQAIAVRARAFDMNIAYFNRNRLPIEQEAGARYCTDLDALLPECDMVILAVPSTPQTRGLIDRGRIDRMKNGVIVVNVGRGDLIQDEALIEALSDGRIAAAGLDVFNNEPALDPRYLTLTNVFATPHIGSSTIETRMRMAQCLIDGIAGFRMGNHPNNRIA